MKTDKVNPPTEAQRRKLVALGGDPDLPQTIHHASQLINKLLLANPAGQSDYSNRLRVAAQITYERTQQHADYV